MDEVSNEEKNMATYYFCSMATRSTSDVETLLSKMGFPTSMLEAVVDGRKAPSFFNEAHLLSPPPGVISYTEVRDHQGRWSARLILSQRGDRIELWGPDLNGDIVANIFLECRGAAERESTMERISAVFEGELKYAHRSRTQWCIIDDED